MPEPKTFVIWRRRSQDSFMVLREADAEKAWAKAKKAMKKIRRNLGTFPPAPGDAFDIIEACDIG